MVVAVGAPHMEVEVEEAPPTEVEVEEVLAPPMHLHPLAMGLSTER